jgi:hypothetical protein
LGPRCHYRQVFPSSHLVCTHALQARAAALAPIQKIAQTLGVRLHGLGIFEEEFLGKEFLNLIHDPFAISVAIRFDWQAIAHIGKRSLSGGWQERWEH